MGRIIKLAYKVMTETEIMQKVEEFVALPRKERKDKFFDLDPEVRKRARAIIEKRRGIAYRSSEGDMVLTEEMYDAEIARLSEKKEEMAARVSALDNKIAELTNKKIIHYGK
jgi:hypothetical protein